MPGHGWKYNNNWKKPSTSQISGRPRRNYQSGSRGSSDVVTYTYSTYIPDNMLNFIHKKQIEKEYDVRVSIDLNGGVKVSGLNRNRTCKAIDKIRFLISNIATGNPGAGNH